MKKVVAFHLMDGTVRRVKVKTARSVNAKVFADGRGYLKTRERDVLFRRVEVIDIRKKKRRKK